MTDHLSIAVLGNINNWPLILAEGLIALGHRVRLYVNRKDLLHRPESRHPEWAAKYPPWIHDCSSLTDEDLLAETPLLRELAAEIASGTNVVILNDIGPALARHIKCPYAALLTGSDLLYYANPESVALRAASWDWRFKWSARGRHERRRHAALVDRQRDGIAGAQVVSFALRGLLPEADRLLDSIGVAANNRMMIYLSDTARLRPEDVVSKEPFRIFNGCRLLWRQTRDRRYSAQDLKGTDKLLRGYAGYCEAGGAGELHLPRKGQDLPAAQAMVTELGIAGRVTWHEEMSLASFREQIALADIVCDQLADSFPGMVTTDAYALGRPVLANFRNDIFRSYFGSELPGMQARTADEVAECLLAAEKDREQLKRLGRQGRMFAEANLAPAQMARRLLTAFAGRQAASCVK